MKASPPFHYNSLRIDLQKLIHFIFCDKKKIQKNYYNCKEGYNWLWLHNNLRMVDKRTKHIILMEISSKDISRTTRVSITPVVLSFFLSPSTSLPTFSNKKKNQLTITKQSFDFLQKIKRVLLPCDVCLLRFSSITSFLI